MRMFVRAVAFDQLTSGEDITRARSKFGEKLQQWIGSGRLETIGVFADMRGGFFVMDVDSSEQLFELIGDLVDVAHVETHPVVSVETLRHAFEQMPPP